MRINLKQHRPEIWQLKFFFTLFQRKLNAKVTVIHSTPFDFEHHKAPEWKVSLWIDADGNVSDPILLSDFEGK